MKNTLIIWLTLACSLFAQAEEDGWVDSYNRLLSDYVSEGGVDYKTWHSRAEDVKALDEVRKGVAAEKLEGKSEDEKLAFYLNAYNALILYRILDSYPTKGPGGGGFLGRNRFFKAKNLMVAGKKTSFHLLENETIRPTFKEPRIHFALNCASKSCPPLHLKAFDAETLDATLDQLARAFLNGNEQGLKLSSNGKLVNVSKIFDWYEDDFTTDGRLLVFINGYRDEKIEGDPNVRFQTYSWKLNQAGPQE
jgi:hypothetical protein